MHILVIPAWYKSPQHPFRGVFFEEQARALQKRGHRVGVVVPELLAFDSEEKASFFSYDDAGIYTIFQKLKGISKRSSKMNHAYFLFRIFQKAYKTYVKKRGKPDVIHSHVYKYAGMSGAYFSQKTGIPHVFTEHFSAWVNPEVRLPPSDIRMMKNLLKHTDKALAVSAFLQGALNEKTNFSGFEVLPNMLPDLFFQNDTFPEKSRKFRIIYVGNLVRIKNPLFLLRAFSIFIKNYAVDAELHIVGKGVLALSVQEEIEHLQLNERVIMTAELDRKGIKHAIQESHIGVLSSRVETFSIAGIEFMSQGLPVVSTRCGGPETYIRDFNGIIVQDEEAMAQSFYQMYQNYARYNPEQIIAFVKEHFSESVIMDRLEQIYRRLLS